MTEDKGQRAERRPGFATRCVAFLGVGAAAAAVGCGAATAPSATSAAIPTLTVGIPGPGPAYLDVDLAQALGYYQKARVNVNISDAGVVVVTQAAAGQLDLALSGTTALLAPNNEGHHTVDVYAWAIGNPVAAVAVASNSPYHTLMDLSGQKMLVQGVGTSSYGTAAYFSHYIVTHGGKPLDLVSVTSESAINNEVIAGVGAATVGPVSYYESEIQAGKMRLLVDPTSASTRKIFGGVVGNSIWGLASKVNQNKVAVERFLAAVRAADQYVHTHTAAQVATALAKSPFEAGYSISSNTAAVQSFEAFAAPTLGYISKSAWDLSLNEWKLYGLGLNLSSPLFSYSNAVDMAPLNAAAKLNIKF